MLTLTSLNELRAGTFEQEVAGLVHAWRARTDSLKGTTPQRRHGLAPSQLVHALRDAAGVTCELFSSALEAHPSMQHFFCPPGSERERLFGATVDAYSRKWSGEVCFAHPPEEAGELERAVRWALASAREERKRPSLVILLLPSSDGAAPHRRWLEYPEALHLATFPALPCGSATAWATESERPAMGRYELVAMCNPAGRDLLNERWLADVLSRLGAGRAAGGYGLPEMFASPAALPWPWMPVAHPTQAGVQCAYDWGAANMRAQRHGAAAAARLQQLTAQYKPPRRIGEAHTLTTLLACPARTPGANDGEGQQLASQYARDLPPKYEWQTAFFTDGSVQRGEAGQLVGAAVYTHAGGPDGGPRAWRLAVNGSGPNNTIMRAELAALRYWLVEVLGPETAGVVFTDSQAGIHLIRRALNEPHTLKGHLHEGLLTEIADTLVQRAQAGLQTRILKVEAHAGITGNEQADKAAKEAAQPEACLEGTTPSHPPYAGMRWPCFAEPQSDQAGDGTRAANIREGEQHLRPISNLQEALRKRMPHCMRVGGRRVCRTYLRAQQPYSGREGDRALPQESNDCTLKQRLQEAILVARLRHVAGTFWTQRMAHKFGVAASDACPLCGLPDSGGHVRLQCRHPRMQKQYIHRHDATVRLILRELQRHARWGGTFTVLDACQAAELGALGASAKRVPRLMIPPEALSDEDLLKMRPDILVVEGLPAAASEDDLRAAAVHKDRYTVRLIEVGYCADDKWRERIADKLQQHSRLISALQAAGWRSDNGGKPHVIVVGAMGTVYESSMHALTNLGLTPKHSREVLRQAHLLAVKELHTISVTRGKLERAATRPRSLARKKDVD